MLLGSLPERLPVAAPRSTRAGGSLPANQAVQVVHRAPPARCGGRVRNRSPRRSRGWGSARTARLCGSATRPGGGRSLSQALPGACRPQGLATRRVRAVSCNHDGDLEWDRLEAGAP